MTSQSLKYQKSKTDFLLSLSYACFVLIFPWEAITRGGFPDFDNYVYDFDYLIPSDSTAADFYGFSSILEYFTREALWFELIRVLTSITGQASVSLRITTFIILFIWSHFLFKRVNYGLAIIFLLNPYVIDVAMSAIRNGLAWSLVILGLSFRSKPVKAVFFLAGMLIHSTVLVLAILYYLTKLVSRYASGKALLLVGLGMGIFIGLSLTVGNEIVLGFIGDRRVGSNYVSNSGSFLQASLWIILICLQCISTRSYIKENIFVITLLSWYLTMNIFIPWSFRILGALMPVIAVSVVMLPVDKRRVFIYLYLGYLALQYIYWTKILNYFIYY